MEGNEIDMSAARFERPVMKTYLQVPNLSNQEIALPTHAVFGMWIEGDMISRSPGCVIV